MIKAAFASAIIKAVKCQTKRQARLSVFAPAGDMQKIKDATFPPAIGLSNSEGPDIEVFVDDRGAPLLKG